MDAFVAASIWKEMVHTIEQHAPGLADTLALMADQTIQHLLTEDEQNIRGGHIISWEQVKQDLEEPINV